MPLLVEKACRADVPHAVFGNVARSPGIKEFRNVTSGDALSFRRRNAEYSCIKIEREFSRCTEFIEAGAKRKLVGKIDMFGAIMFISNAKFPPRTRHHIDRRSDP